MGDREVKTHCSRMDHGGCGLIVTVADGKVHKISSDQESPISYGYICPKAIAIKERLYHPQRLKRPLIRVGKRGEGRWRRASWSEALNVVAQRLLEIKNGYGAQAVIFAQGAPKGPEFFMLMRLANAFGSPNVAGPQNLCHMPREISSSITCGFWPDVDYEHPPRCIVLWGSNPESTNEEGIISSRLNRAIRRGSKLVVVDPFPTRPARRADLWLRIRPGSDAALAMGMMRVIVEESLQDKEFIRNWTIGYDRLVERLMEVPLHEVESMTWVPEGLLREAARLYATQRPSAIQWGNALEHHSSSHQACRAILCLMALCGNLEVPGGNIRAGYPPTLPLREFVLADAISDRRKLAIHANHDLHGSLVSVPVQMTLAAIRDGMPYPIKAMYIQGTNPLSTWPDAYSVLEALMRLDFIVVSEIFMTPTCAIADVVFPAATHMEFEDIGHYGLPHGFVLARHKIVEPPGEAWLDIRILNELAKAVGLGHLFWENERAVLDEILRPSGLDCREFMQRGLLLNPKKYHTYREKGFKTPSGKVELFSSILEGRDLDPLPSAGGHHQPQCQDYPFILTTAKSPFFFHSANRQLQGLRKMSPHPSVALSPEAASRLMVREGQWVWLVTTKGRVRMRVVIQDGLDPRVVCASHGWWFPEAEESTLFQWDVSNINVIINGGLHHDPLVGSIQLRGISCALEAGAPPIEKGGL